MTGATGFTGAHLTQRLLELGHQVIGLDNQPGLSANELQSRGAELHLGSVTDAPLINRLVQGCDRVYHLAAAFRKVNLPKKVYWDVNVNGTRHVLEAARRHQVPRVLYCSTCGVHGNVRQLPANEEAPIAPADWYQQTKWRGEVVCREFIDEGMWVTIVRPAAIYGPGDPERFSMLFRRVATGRFLMVGDGRTHYHPLYVSNLIDAMVAAIETDAAQGKAYLIADTQSLEIGQLVQEIASVLQRSVRFVHLPYWPIFLAAVACEVVYSPLPWEPPLFRRRLDWFVQNRSFDITAARTDLGYDPQIGLREGLARTAKWYREHGILPPHNGKPS